MAKRALKTEFNAKTGMNAAAPTAETLRVNGGLASPARQLQSYLDTEIHHADDIEGRWSPMQTVLFVVATCGSFWAAVWFGVSMLLG